MAFILFLVAIAPVEVIGAWRHLDQAIPPETALFVAAVGYPATFLHLRKRLSWSGHLVLAAVLAGLLMAAALSTTVMRQSDPALSLGLSLLGLSVAALGLWSGHLSNHFKLLSQRGLAALAAVVALYFTVPLTKPLLLLTISDLPQVVDPVLDHMDDLVGIRLSAFFGRLLAHNDAARWLVQAVYYGLLGPIFCVLFSEARWAPKSLNGVALHFLVASFIGYPLYYLMPAMGPAYFYGNLFPFHMPASLSDAQMIATPLAIVRNTMPSLHATWAILCLLALRYSPLWHRLLGGLLVAVIFVATLGLGEHYAVDWLGALPLVVLVRGLCCQVLPLQAKARSSAILTGAVLLLGWVVILRLSPDSLDFIQACRMYCLISLVVPIVMERALARAEQCRQGAVTTAWQQVSLLDGQSLDAEVLQAQYAATPIVERR
jgi:hypothetical protein